MEKEKTDWRPIWLYLLITVVGVIIISFIGGIIASVKEIPVEEMTATSNVIATIVSEIIILIVFLIIYRKKLFEDTKAINKKQIILIVVSSILLISINSVITNLFELLNVSMNNQETIVKLLEKFEIPTTILAVICAPIIEELVFRYSLGTACKKDKVFVIISGLLFGFAHGVGIASILYIYIGVSLAIIYLKSNKNIMVPITVHFLNNLFSVVLTLIL